MDDTAVIFIYLFIFLAGTERDSLFSKTFIAVNEQEAIYSERYSSPGHIHQVIFSLLQRPYG